MNWAINIISFDFFVVYSNFVSLSFYMLLNNFLTMTTVIKFCLFIILFFTGCIASQAPVAKPQLVDDTRFLLTEVSIDATYGVTPKNPIKVGGTENSEGPKNERRFLNALAGPNGEPIKYQRIGSCCEFSTKHGFMGKGLLDSYEILWEGQSKPLTIYINMYDYGVLKAPMGLTIRK